jgi:hypothetical protein
MEDFFRCEDLYEASLDVVATMCRKELIVYMHYEASIQATISFQATILGEKANKKDARTMSFT